MYELKQLDWSNRKRAVWNSYCTDWGPAVQLILLNLTPFQASSVTKNTYGFVLHQVIEQRGRTEFLSLHSFVNYQQSFVSAAVGSSSCCELHCNSTPTLPLHLKMCLTYCHFTCFWCLFFFTAVFWCCLLCSELTIWWHGRARRSALPSSS